MSTTIDLASDPGAEHRARDLRTRLACIIPALQPTTRGLSGLAVAAALSLCGATGILLIRLEPLFVIGAVTLAVATILMFRWPELGTLLGFLALYTNAPAVAVHFHGSPNAVAVSFLPLFGVPLFYYILYRREKLILDRTFRLMLALLLATTVSACFSKGLGIALEWILTFAVEGLVLYFLITNVVRTLPTLKRVVAVLLIASAFLGGLSLLQEFGHSYSNQFGGLAQKNLEFVKGEEEFRSAQEKVRLANRAEGPLGDANRYAQILIVLAPLGLVAFFGARSLPSQLAWALVLMLILAGIFLSYSRGGFVALALLGVLCGAMGLLPPRSMAAAFVLILLLAPLAAPDYLGRIMSLSTAKNLTSRENAGQADGAIRGRATEMLAAANVFTDHPLIGVGPGQYAPFYSIDYQSNPDIAFRHIPQTRRAHSLYLELAAETGLVGLGIFLFMVGGLMRQLWQFRSRFRDQFPELEMLAAGVFLGLTGYMATAVFLHLSFQRYFWLLLGLAAVTVRILRLHDKGLKQMPARLRTGPVRLRPEEGNAYD